MKICHDDQSISPIHKNPFPYWSTWANMPCILLYLLFKYKLLCMGLMAGKQFHHSGKNTIYYIHIMCIYNDMIY